MLGSPEKFRIDESLSFSRRKFLKFMAWFGSILTLLKLIPGFSWANGASKQAPDMVSPLPKLPSSVNSKLLRMQKEVQETMRKPGEDRDWVMVIDLKKCVGCHACTVACVAENNLPPGVVYRPVFEEEAGSYPQVTRNFLPRPCMQCNVPPCVPVCPTNATYKREDGIVPIDYNRCIGCRACIKACPYGSRIFDFGENHTEHTVNFPQPYEVSPTLEYGSHWDREKRKPPIGVVRKCHFCNHRLREGMLPSCVTTCIGGATYFGPGPKSNPNSLVSQLINSSRVMRLKLGLGTEPRVYYLRQE